MIAAIARKTRQVANDPVLRRWLIGRALGRIAGPPPFTAHRPPYLESLLPLATEEQASTPGGEAPAGEVATPLTLDLPGESVDVAPQAPGALFERTFSDTETLLAVHRFAWLPLTADHIDPRWVTMLWQAWAARFGLPDESWAWHPYTASERAINLLDFAQRHGAPAAADGTARLLARHGPAIAERLEYFGEHHTSNHLSNNGRGLYRLGLALGLPAATTVGLRILLAEAERIFAPSGVLREGSSHYHMLLTRNYADAWLAARAHGRQETRALETITCRALSVLPHVNLPGGLPLVGDISPDAPPAYFTGLMPGGDLLTGWAGNLREEDREALRTLRDKVLPADADALRRDGWMRVNRGPWSGLWHAAPEGWSCIPGHGHQDLGSFELHHGTTVVFADAGRGAYGDAGDAALYRAAGVHNTLTLDGEDPYPSNRPYYDAEFRSALGGPPPLVRRESDGVILAHHGYERLGGPGAVSRQWRFADRDIIVDDIVAGRGRRRIRRALLTPLKVIVDGREARLEGDSKRFRLNADGALQVEAVTRWTAYGRGSPASLIVAEQRASLPWRGRMTLTVESA